MLPFVPKNLKWSVTLHCPNENLALICISSVRAACTMTHVSLDYVVITVLTKKWKVYVMTLLSVQLLHLCWL